MGTVAISRTHSDPRNPANSSRRLDWQEFLREFDWQQGEHITLIGPTGSGKTTLAIKLLPRRRYIAVFATKREDSTMRRLQKSGGYRIIRKWQPNTADERVILWPDLKGFDSIKGQAQIFWSAMGSIFRSGGWTLFWDEVTYLSQFLKLERAMAVLWQQGRALKISIVAGSQRPAYVPLYAYDQATHLFFWRDNDDVNLRRLSNLGGMDAATIRGEVATLEKHEVLYLNTRTGERIITLPEV